MNGWYPRPPARYGWHVGVGQDEEEDAFTLGRRLLEEAGRPTTPVEALPTRVRQRLPPLQVSPPPPPATPTTDRPVPQTEEELAARIGESSMNPLQRLGQIKDEIGHDWLSGGLTAAFAPLEPRTTVAHIGAGIAQGVNQWAAEHYAPQLAPYARGAAAAIRENPLQAIPAAAAALSAIPAIPALYGKFALDAITGQAPEALPESQGPGGYNQSLPLAGQSGWVPPARNLREIVDPSYAIARSHGNAPGLYSMPVDMLAMGKMTPLPGGNIPGLGAPAMETAMGAARGVAERVHPGWGTPTAVAPSPITTALNRVGDFASAYGLPAGAALGTTAGAAKGVTDAQGLEPVEAAQVIGLNTFAGAVLGTMGGATLTSMGRGLSGIARVDPVLSEGRIKFTNSPGNRTVQEAELSVDRKLAEIGTTEAYPYPGGTDRQMLAAGRAMFTERFAHLEDWNSYRMAQGIPVTEDLTQAAHLLSGVEAKVAGQVYDHLGGILGSVGVHNRNLPSFYEHQNRVVQARWAKDGHYFLKDVQSEADANRLLLETRQAITDQYPQGVFNPKSKATVPTYVAWENAMERITDEVHNPQLRALEAVGRLRPGKAEEIIKAQPVYTAVDDLAMVDSAIRNITPGKGGIAATGQPAGYAHSTEGVGAGSFQSEYRKMLRLETMIARQQVMNDIVRFAEADPQGFGKYFIEVGPAVKHRAISEAQLEGRGIQSNLYGPMAKAGTPGVPGTAKAGATSSAGLMDVKRQFQPDAQMFIREGAESVTVPQGWQAVPHWKNGVPYIYRAPEGFGDAIMGWNRYDVGVFAEFLSKMTGTQAFRTGITVGSAPFIIAGFPRDVQNIFQNLGAGAAFAHLHQGLFESAMKGLGVTDFYARHASNPVVENAAEALAVRMKPVYEAVEKGILGVDAGGAPIRTLPTFLAQGGGMGGVMENITHTDIPKRALNLARGPSELTGGARAKEIAGEVAGLANPVEWGKGGFEALKTVAQTLELAPRLGVMRWAFHDKKLSARESAYLARGGSVDFSKAGYVAASLNKILPLFNPRVQGELRSIKAMAEDPAGWQLRAFVGTGLPTMALWALQRAVWGDAKEGFSQKELDNNWIIPTGVWTDEKGDDHGIGIPIRKDAMGALISTPLTYYLDMHHNLTRGDLPLEEHQRSRRSAAQVAVDTLMNLVPVNLNGDEVANPMAWGMGLAAMNPAIATVAGLSSGSSAFTGRPIDPKWTEDLPWEYHADSRTPESFRAISQLLRKSNIPIPDKLGEKLLAPSRLDFATRSMGGTAATTVIGWGGSGALGILKYMGVIDPDAFTPTTWEDFHMPPEIAQGRREELMYLSDQMRTQDHRPFWTKIGAVLRVGGGGEAIAERVARLDTKTQKQITQSWAAMAQVRGASDAINREKTTFWNSTELVTHTQQEVRDKLHNWSEQRKGAYRDAFQGEGRDYAVRNPQQLRDVLDKIPGVPTNAYQRSLPNLPEGVTAQSIYDEVVAAAKPEASFYEAGRIRSQTIGHIADRLRLPDAVVREQYASVVLGKHVPMVDVPNLWLEKVLNDWLEPPGVTPNTRARDVVKRQREVIIQYAAEAPGMTPELLQERLSARIAGQGEMTPLQRSYTKALAMAQEIHDPAKYPSLSDSAGGPVGHPDTWEAERARVQYHRSLGKPRATWPPDIQAIDTAMRYAEANRIKGMLASENYGDYERWFGTGAGMTVGEWTDYQNGTVAKYRTGTPREWLSRDLIMRLYNTLPPNDPERNQWRPQYQRWRQEINKGWREILKLDDLERNGMFIAS